MARLVVNPPQELADEHTLVAQRYAGYLVGHPYRQPQQTTTVEVDRRRQWEEPNIVADDCIFCARLTDEEAERRVAGMQYAIDIEATRSKSQYYLGWLASGSPDVIDPGEGASHSRETQLANRRRFCELFQDMPTERRPDGWKTRPLPLIALPLRLKRKLCIEWNHIYLPWMKENNLQYDFEQHQFYCEVPEEAQGPKCPECAVVLAPDACHADGCLLAEALTCAVDAPTDEVTFLTCTACAAELGPDADHADGCTGVAGEPLRLGNE